MIPKRMLKNRNKKSIWADIIFKVNIEASNKL